MFRYFSGECNLLEAYSSIQLGHGIHAILLKNRFRYGLWLAYGAQIKHFDEN